MTDRYAGLPRVVYTEPKRREALRRLRIRATGDAEFTNYTLLAQLGLDTNTSLLDYLRVWSVNAGEDLTHLAGGEAPPEPPKKRGRPRKEEAHEVLT